MTCTQVKHGDVNMIFRSSTFLVFVALIWTLSLAGCGQGRTVDGLAPSVPDAEPCGDGCPAGTSCVPGIDEDGNPSFLCIDVHNLFFCSDAYPFSQFEISRQQLSMWKQLV